MADQRQNHWTVAEFRHGGECLQHSHSEGSDGKTGSQVILGYLVLNNLVSTFTKARNTKVIAKVHTEAGKAEYPHKEIEVYPYSPVQKLTWNFWKKLLKYLKDWR